jgi:hypothetical protein
MGRLISVESSSFNFPIVVLKGVWVRVRSNWWLVTVPFVLEMSLSRSIVPVRSSRFFSNYSDCLVRLILIWARIVVVLWLIRSGEMSRLVRVESSSFNFTIVVLESVGVRVCSNWRLVTIPFIFEMSLSRSNGSISSSW